MDCLSRCCWAPLILHLLPIHAGVKVQSILWCAWPPPGRSSTLKIACGSNIDDIRGNTKFVANYFHFLENSITVDSLNFCCKSCVLCFSSPPKKFHQNRTPNVENTLV